MTSRFAANTEVSVEKSRSEIEKLITRYGATSTAFMVTPGRAMILFEVKERRVAFELLLPDIGEKRFQKNGYGYQLAADKVRTKWEQGCRSRWRALVLVIKAKLEAVESGITTFEDEFMAHIVLPDGSTVGQHVRPSIKAAYETNTMQPLLPPPRPQ